MTLLAKAADAALEASVVGSYSRIGLAARSRLLPEFTAARPASLEGQVVVITGATSGIGQAAATGLARLGATVHFLARDPARAAAALRQISKASGSTSISYAIADMEDLDSVCSFATQYLRSHGRLDVLIHNASAIHATYQASKEGFELTVAGQVVAPFLLTSLLLPALLAAGRSRVITVSSAGMYTQRFDPAILRMPAVGYQGVAAYAKAKRAQVVLSENWAKELAGTGVSFHAMHPGWVDTPGIAVALPGFYRVMRPLLRTPQQGADTIIWLATADPARLGTGRFWHDRRPRSEYRLPWTRNAPTTSTRGFWHHVRAASGIWDQ